MSKCVFCNLKIEGAEPIRWDSELEKGMLICRECAEEILNDKKHIRILPARQSSGLFTLRWLAKLELDLSYYKEQIEKEKENGDENRIT